MVDINSNMKPLVSIIIPCYNSEEWVQVAIKSCINQSYRNIEIICVNDGSSDCTLEKIRKIDDPRLVVLNKKNEGVAKARFDGLNKSKGEFLFFLDADDYISVHAIELLVTKYKETKSDAIIAQMVVVGCRNRRVSSFKVVDNDAVKSFLYGYLPPNMSPILYRKKILASVRMESKLIVAEDFYVNAQFFSETSNVSTINDIIYTYVKHDASVTANSTYKKFLHDYKSNLNGLNLLKKKVGNTDAVDVFLTRYLYGCLRKGSPFSFNTSKIMKEEGCKISFPEGNRGVYVMYTLQLCLRYPSFAFVLSRVVSLLKHVLKKYCFMI